MSSTEPEQDNAGNRAWRRWFADRNPSDFVPRWMGGRTGDEPDPPAGSVDGDQVSGEFDDGEHAPGEQPAPDDADAGDDDSPEMPGGVTSGFGALGSATVTSLSTLSPRRRKRDPFRSVDFNDLGVDRGGIVAAIDGVPLALRESGPSNAPLTVVFVHGYTLTMNTWYFQQRALRERFGRDIRMVFYDQRGHGKSGETPQKRATITQLGLDLNSVIEATAPSGPVVLVGHSMGGMTVMSYLRQHEVAARKRIVGIALVATAAGKLSEAGIGNLLANRAIASFAGAAGRAPGVFHNGRRAASGFITPFLYGGSFGDPATISPAVARFVARTISATEVGTMSFFYDALRNHDESPALRIVRDITTTIICGDRDILTPLERSVEIHEEVPDSRFEVVPRSGHMVMLEHPDIVNDLLIDLIDTSVENARIRI